MKRRRTPKKPVIKFRQTLFWDVDPKTIDPQRHARYVIERVLDFGDEKEVRWLVHYYPPRLIKKTLHEPRSPLHEKSKTLWSLVFR